MSANQNSALVTEMDFFKRFGKLTPEERRKETRRRMYEELRAVEMERRERVREELEKEREEREQLEEGRRMHEANHRAGEERKADDLKALQKAEEEQLKQERLCWNNERSGYTSAQKMEQQAGPCILLWEGDRTYPDFLTPDLKTPYHQDRKETLINNWVDDPETESAAIGEPDPLESTKSGDISVNQTPKSKELEQGMPDTTMVWDLKEFEKQYA